MLSAAMCLSLAPSWVYAETEIADIDYGNEWTETDNPSDPETMEEDAPVSVPEEMESEETAEEEDAALEEEIPAEDILDHSVDFSDEEEIDITDEVVSESMLDGNLSQHVSWTLTGTAVRGYTLTINGTGVIPDYFDEEDVPWYSIRDSIKIINMSDDITAIGNLAFAYCTNLTTVNIGAGVTSIGYGSFEGCSKLETVVLPDGFEYLDDWAFSECTNLSRAVLPGSCTFLSGTAFYHCSKLVIYGPSGSMVESYATSNYIPFYGDMTGKCGRGMRYYLTGSKETGYTLELTGAGTMYEYESYNKVPWNHFSDDITEIIIEDGINSIGNFAFAYCSKLKEISIPSTVTSIGKSAFVLCIKLETVDFSDNLTSIGDGAFLLCSALKFISLPEKVTTIGVSSFAYCSEAKLIYIPNSVTSIGNDAFTGSANLTIYGHSGSTGLQYASDNGISSKTCLGAGGCGSDSYYVISKRASFLSMRIEGSGEMTDYPTASAAPWYSSREAMRNIQIASGITAIGSNAFAGCSRLTISIPSSVTSIGDGAFSDCGELTIKGSAGSYAQTYAEENNITFETEAGSVAIVTQPENITAKVKDTITFSLKASDAVSYLWQYSKDGKSWVNSSASGCKTEALTLTVSSSNKNNMYHCIVTGADGTKVTSNTVKVDLIPGATITAQPETQFAEKTGGTVTFTVAAENATAFQWYYSPDAGATWYKSGASGNNTAALIMTVNATNIKRQYRCKVTGLDGSITTSAKAGIILLSAQPKNSSFSTGKTATFSVTAQNIETYQWQYSKDGGKTWYSSTATGAKTESMSLKLSTSNYANLYRCKLTTTSGTVGYSQPAGFSGGMILKTEPKNVTAAAGKAITFSVTADNVKSYQWYYSKDGATWYKSGASGSTTDTLKLTVSSSNNGNQYRCKITDKNGYSYTTKAAGITMS